MGSRSRSVAPRRISVNPATPALGQSLTRSTPFITMPRNAPAATGGRRRRLTDLEVTRLASRFRRAQLLKKRCERVQGESQAELLAELELRGVPHLRIGDTAITRAQGPPSVSYDAEALWKELKPRDRRGLVVETLDLNALPAELRARIEAMLTPSERAGVTIRTVDAKALDAAVASGRVPEDLVRRIRSVKAKAPYVVVTDATASAGATPE